MSRSNEVEAVTQNEMKLREPCTWRLAVLICAFAFVAALYAYQFWIQGGRNYLSVDGQIYLAVARGETVMWPLNTRLLVPLIASQLSRALGISAHSAFLLITPVCLFTSLVLLVQFLVRRGASIAYQAAIVLAFGSAMAVLFGHTPLLVDTPLLLLACLTIAALDRQRFGLALVVICVATLTKEYGALLALPWAVETYKRSGWRMAGAALIPILILIGAMLLRPAAPRVTTGELFDYHRTLIAQSGLFVYFKTLYLWMWAVLWPVLALLTLRALFAASGKVTLTSDQLRYAALLVGVPLLLLGDIDRAAMHIVPFAGVAATSVVQFQHARICILLSAAGLATSLARPLYTEVSVPRAFTLTMIAISLVCSTLLVTSMATLERASALVVKA